MIGELFSNMSVGLSVLVLNFFIVGLGISIFRFHLLYIGAESIFLTSEMNELTGNQNIPNPKQITKNSGEIIWFLKNDWVKEIKDFDFNFDKQPFVIDEIYVTESMGNLRVEKNKLGTDGGTEKLFGRNIFSIPPNSLYVFKLKVHSSDKKSFIELCKNLRKTMDNRDEKNFL